MLPVNNAEWPPREWRTVYDLYTEHAAWYSGDPANLLTVYAGKLTPFWSDMVKTERRVMLHVPVAGDIAATSAAMLFSEHPRIQIPEAAEENAPQDALDSQVRLEEIIGDGNIYSKLLEAAEICSALGGVLIKVNWDRNLVDYPILSISQADNALPEFRHGILTGVTLWKELPPLDDSSTVWRLFEEHQKGVIRSALYRGTAVNTGASVEFTAHPEAVGTPDVVITGIDDLVVRYIPNIRPHRRLRGWYLGQSDYSGSEGLMDSLDEAYTSLLRDIRLGVGRIIAPEEFFEFDTNKKLKFDVNREAYMALNTPVSATGANQQITISQFDIRTEQHLAAIRDMLVQTFINAGYSPQSFGLDIAGNAESGTALRVRERKSLITTAKKAEYWRSAVEDILELMMQVDKLHLGGRVAPMRPRLEIQDSIQNDPAETATSVELLNRARAASKRVLVEMLHPDWTKAQIVAEVEEIKGEDGANVPDMFQAGVA